MKKSISINLQGLVFHIEEDGFEVLRRYLADVKAHFARQAGHEEIVADIEARIAELFTARLTPSNQVIGLADVEAVTAQLGSVADFAAADAEQDDDAADASRADRDSRQTAPGAGQAAGSAAGSTTDPAAPRQLFRDETNKKVAGVAAGLGHYFNVNPLWFRLAFVLTALLNTSPFGDLDRHFSINFGGISILTYFILWLVMPKRVGLTLAGGPDTRGPGAGRKLFRDTQAGSVGGVAAGLAHYLRVDVTLVRVAFVVLLLGFGTGFLLYLVLWLVVPEARTLTDRLEMRGEDVTLSNLSQMQAEGGPLGAGRARVVQENLRSVGSSVAPIFRFLFTLVAGFAALIMLIIALAMLVAVGAVLGVILGAFPAGGWVHTGDIPAELLRNTLPVWGLVAGFVVFLIPTISLLLAAVRIFVKRPILTPSARLSLFGIWLVALLTLGAAFARLQADFRERAEVSTRQEFAAPAGRIVVLEAGPSDDLDLRPDRLNVVQADSGQPLRLTVRVRADGATVAAARQATGQVEYRAVLNDSTLTLPRDFRFKPGAAWREHKVYLALALPADRAYRLTEGFANLLDNDVYDDRYSRDNQNGKRLFTVKNGRFELLSGPETTLIDDEDNDGNDDDDGNFDIDVNGEHIRIRMPDFSSGGGYTLREPAANAPRRTITESGFERIEASGAYQVRIRRGDAFRITARGSQAELDRLVVERNGQTLEIHSKSSIGFRGWHSSRRNAVLVEVEMPTLRGLDLSGAARADVAGFQDSDDVKIEQSGAAWLRFDGSGSPLNVDLSGAAHLLLTGTTPRLRGEIGGAAELNAAKLQATDVDVEATGAARAAVRATGSLRADASGAAHITYYGRPANVQREHSGAGTVRRAADDGDEAADDEASAEDKTNDDETNDDTNGE